MYISTLLLYSKIINSNILYIYTVYNQRLDNHRQYETHLCWLSSSLILL
ncbi:unnamed protein product [Schistosoma mattheei]|uniref:Uncharacterized protein n=1 Tax=Schistosoma mattheei TaxID=31246 RepID=A0A183NIM3_9TREM|nr:unnamed protein product [Schistosoma mattheei]